MEDSRPVYKLPEYVDRQKVYPGIKDLPSHIRLNFRNGFIRYVIRNIFNSEQPWANPDLSTLQRTYDQVYPAYPARLQHNDAVFHPVSTFIFLRHGRSFTHLSQTITSIGVVRNRIGTSALSAAQHYLTALFRQKQLKTLDARAKLVSSQFKSDDDHLLIWRQYTVSNIPNHSEIGGCQVVSIEILNRFCSN